MVTAADPASPEEQWVGPLEQVDTVESADPEGLAYVRGVAAVPIVPRPRRDDTGAYPAATAAPASPVAPSPPRGMVVRWRWRRLRAGAGWSWTGGSFMVVCWGIWAITLRGGDLLGPVLTLALVFATAGLVFTVCRLLGRAVLENTLGRVRHSAWPSHLTAGGFMTLAGLAFLQQTWWVANGWQWLVDRLVP